ncbi:MAG: four helix bundle protein [Candidatus Sumerlaeota bacterium]|nr:four helix bundle protein [Candidatus Sumerlaeota bacterium]
MKPKGLKDRPKAFALRVMKLVNSLPNTLAERTVGGQLLDSAASVAANYRAACRARSKAEFIAKLGIVEEEADESIFWLELIRDGDLMRAERIGDLLKEGDEILSIMVASRKSARFGSSRGESSGN